MSRGFRFGVGLAALLAGGFEASRAGAETSQLRVIRPYDAPPARPRVIKAEPGSTPPDGYHPEQRMRVGLTISGIAASGVGALLIAQGLIVHDQANRVQVNGSGDHMDFSPIFYVLGTLHLAVGIPLLVVGLTDRKDVYVRDQIALTLAPQIGPDRAGGALRITF